ncbi:MAG: outer membrane beta-barrel protein [Azoarcus sp.]|jgi:outer membrane protein|nr:outer membrane beta-barrel protein [Azoarcus sp.]
MYKKILAASIAALSLSGAAVAHEAGDFILRGGVIHAEPDSSSSKIKVNGVSQPGSGVNADGGNKTQFGLGMTYMVMPHFGLEVTASTPFTHKIRAKYGGVNYNRAETSRMSPTISAQYFFLNPKSKFQPYVGLGLNYTIFHNEKLSNEAKRDYNAKSLKIKNSVGIVAQVGMDYKVTERVVLNASAWKMSMSAKATWKEDWGGGEQKMKVDMDIDPWVYFIGVGYKF